MLTLSLELLALARRRWARVFLFCFSAADEFSLLFIKRKRKSRPAGNLKIATENVLCNCCELLGMRRGTFSLPNKLPYFDPSLKMTSSASRRFFLFFFFSVSPSIPIAQSPEWGWVGGEGWGVRMWVGCEGNNSRKWQHPASLQRAHNGLAPAQSAQSVSPPSKPAWISYLVYELLIFRLRIQGCGIKNLMNPAESERALIAWKNRQKLIIFFFGREVEIWVALNSIVFM